MESRRRSRPHCARCGGPKRHPSQASIVCLRCGDMICTRHAVAAEDASGWVCTKCSRIREGE